MIFISSCFLRKDDAMAVLRTIRLFDLLFEA